MNAIGTNPVRLGNRTYRPEIYGVFLLKLTLMGRVKRNLTGLKRVSGIEKSLTLHPPNAKRVFGVDLWVERRNPLCVNFMIYLLMEDFGNTIRAAYIKNKYVHQLFSYAISNSCYVQNIDDTVTIDIRAYIL